MSDVLVILNRHPVPGRDVVTDNVPARTRLSEIIAAAPLDPHFAYVAEVAGDHGGAVVPQDAWHLVRPKSGAVVTIYPDVQGRDAVASLAVVALTLAAGHFGLAAGSALFGAGTFGAKAVAAIATMAASAVGNLVASKLIAPPEPASLGGSSDAFFDIGGTSNEIRRYQPIPVILGRHRIFPPKSALPWTESDGDTVTLHERLTLGYGPLALETLKIGDTPIHQFRDVDIEFRNVDKAQTLARYPEIAPLVKIWRYGSDPMTICSEDSQTTAVDIELPQNAPVSLNTTIDTRRVALDFAFKSGLIAYRKKDGKPFSQYCTLSVEARPAGSSGAYTTLATLSLTGKSAAPLRFTRAWDMPSEGQWEIKVERLDRVENDVDATWQDRAHLVALRSIQSGRLPSHPDTAEVAIRVRASDQLSGPLDQLNAIAHQMAPAWRNGAWTAPQPIRHVADVFAAVLRGPNLKHTVSDTGLDLDGLEAFRAAYPDRTCDYVVSGERRVADVLDVIAAAGRARRTVRAFKHTLIDDQANAPAVQMFGPHNSRNFQGEVTFPKEIHGFHVRVVSEDADWQQDEVTVYADGYSAANATIFETLDLPGIVLEAGQVDGGLAWKDGRYQLAQHFLRPEVWTLEVDLEHLVCFQGAKVLLAHDVPRLGLGTARITHARSAGGNLTDLVLSEELDIAAGPYSLRVRSADGTITTFAAELRTDGAAGLTRYGIGGTEPSLVLDFAGGVYATTRHDGAPSLALDFAGGIYDQSPAVMQAVPEARQYWLPLEDVTAEIAADDLVFVEEGGPMEAIVTKIEPRGDQQALLTLIPASPAVLDADSGVIPPYDPLVSRAIQGSETAAPQLRRMFSGPQAVLSAPGAVDQPRIGVEMEPQDGYSLPVLAYRLRWREVGQEVWTASETQAAVGALYTGPLESRQTYEIQIETQGYGGRLRGWTDLGQYTAYLTDVPPGPVQDLRVDVLLEQARLSWKPPVAVNVDFYEVRHSTNPAATWGESLIASPEVRQTEVLLPGLNGVYHVRARNHEGTLSDTSATVQVTSGGVLQRNVVQTISAGPTWTGFTAGTAYVSGGSVYMDNASNDIHGWASIHDVDDIHTYGDVSGPGYFQLTETCYLGAVYTSRVTVSLSGGGTNPNNSIHDWTNIHDVDDIHGASEDSWTLGVEISTTEDTGGSPTWGPWRDLISGDYKFAQARFRVVGEALDDSTLVQIDDVAITIDMPDRIERGSDVAHTTGGTAITYPAPFQAKPTLVIDGQNLPSGARVLRSGESASGFTVNFKDSGGTDLAGVTFDYTAIGYGVEE